MGQITATRNLVATKVVRHAGQSKARKCRPTARHISQWMYLCSGYEITRMYHLWYWVKVSFRASSHTYIISYLITGHWKLLLEFWWFISRLISMLDIVSIFCEMILMSLLHHKYLSGDKSTLVQVRSCCRQAKSHYLNQWWPICMGLMWGRCVEIYQTTRIRF